MTNGKGIYVGGTLISILLSLALYFTGKRESAIFVGSDHPQFGPEPPGGRLDSCYDDSIAIVGPDNLANVKLL